MPRKKINEDEILKEKNKNEKVSSVEKRKKVDEKNGKEKNTKKSNSTKEEKVSVSKKALPKAKEKKALPKVKEQKKLPKVEEKKSLPKAKNKKELPKPKDKKMLPKTKVKKELPKALTEEEKDLKLLEKIKEFFTRNPDKVSKLDETVDENSNYLPEYYDLPYRYNETVVKILAQTPKRLFIYWDISDNDIQKYRRAFGEDFFEKTYPVLLVHNEEMNYTYEVPINDFANSWYLDIKDSKCKYSVQLGRKFKEYPRILQKNQEIVKEEKINLQNDYIQIVSSNILEAPNDHVLFEEMKSTITYRNVKTHQESTKEIKNLINGFAKVYNVYDLYKVIYKDEMESSGMFDFNNPSSAGNPSSSMTSNMLK